MTNEYVFGSGDDHNYRQNVKVLQPVVSEASLERLLGLIEDAKRKGGRILCGGARENRQGSFLQPTIIADCNDFMTCQEEEIFGPILPVRSFTDEDDVFALANDSEYGLSSYVFTKSLDVMLRAEQELMTGNVCINGIHYSIELPHGGVKQSGYGKDISHLSLRDYLDIRRITIKRSAFDRLDHLAVVSTLVSSRAG